MTKLSLLVASLPDRESVVVELWHDDVQFAEVSSDGDGLVVEFYPHPSGAPWALDWSDVVACLTQAGARLRGAGPEEP